MVELDRGDHRSGSSSAGGARRLHQRWLERGRIPLLSWHHVEELLGGEDDDAAQARCAFLEDLPLLAWLRAPGEDIGVGSVVQILVAETIAIGEGRRTLIDVRDRAKELVVRTGSGAEAIGCDTAAWMSLRRLIRSRRPHLQLIAAVSPMQIFDESRTIGELAQMPLNPPEAVRRRLKTIHVQMLGPMTEAAAGDHVLG